MSYLGPFFSVSVLIDDDPKLAEQLFTGESLVETSFNSALQYELEFSRVSIHTAYFKMHLFVIFIYNICRIHFTKSVTLF
jgi:hypothetical protein